MRSYFVEAGVRAASVHSGPTSAGRVDALRRLDDGLLDVVFAVDMFNEGVDVRSIDTVLMLRPTESKVLWLQQIGRGLRKADGKPLLTIIDYIGNHKVFLNKAAGLLAALGVEASGRDQIEYLREGRYDLPPGCEVTYDLEALEILERLFPRARPSQALSAWYEAFREQEGERPRALQAYQCGYNPVTARADFGSWFGLVRAMADLDEAEQHAFDDAGSLLTALATEPMPSAEPLVVLEALMKVGAFPGTCSVARAVDACSRVVDRSAILRREVRADEALVRRVAERWPSLAMSGAEVTVGASQWTCNAETLEDLVSELLAWRLARYLDDRRGQVRFKVLRNPSDKAILKIDRRRFDLPDGWVTVDIGDRPYKAKFVKEFVNVVADDEGEPNRLDELMRDWFGPDAGKRGTSYSVVHEALPNGRYRWIPALYGDPNAGVPVRDDQGAAIDARFNVEELDDHSVTIVFMSRNKGRNDEYNRGLEQILARLAARRLVIERIALDSASTKNVPLPDRTLPIEGSSYPVKPHEAGDLAALRRKIGRSMAQLQRRPGAKGSGNMNKRIRIWVRGSTAPELKNLIG